MLKRVIIVALLIGVIAAAVWILSGPKKELATLIQWSKDEATGQIVPIFLVYYKWDGVKDWSETWMIFPKEEKWWVIDIREFTTTGTQQNLERSLQHRRHAFSQEFNEMWISDRRFQPAPSRYEAVMMGVGFNVLFTAEKDAFRNVLRGTQAFDEGDLSPEE